MNFFTVALIWLVFFAICGLLILIFGEAMEYILGLAGITILVYVVFFGRGSDMGDGNFPEPPDFD